MASQRILIVDDDRDSLRLIGRVLARQGYTISEALNGAMALDRIRAEAPHLILLDIMMPDMDGYEVARRIRSSPEMADVPIIMFTAKGMVADKVAGFEAGADDYLTKPTHPAELTARVKSVLERSAGRQRASPQAEQKAGRRAPVIAFIGTKGGAGTTTLALNVALALAGIAADRPDFKPILAEIKPGYGAMGLLVNVPLTEGLLTILSKDPPDLTAKSIERHLIPHPSGLRLLLAPVQPSPYDDRLTPELAEKLVSSLAAAGSLVLLDLGSGLDATSRRILPLVDQVVIVTEPERVALWMGGQMAEEVKKLGVNPTRVVAVLINRTASTIPVSFEKIQEQLGIGLLSIIAAAHELAHEAVETTTPMVALQPNSLPAQQFRKLADDLLQRTGITASATLVSRSVTPPQV